jgi:hypothetical protein
MQQILMVSQRRGWADDRADGDSLLCLDVDTVIIASCRNTRHALPFPEWANGTVPTVSIFITIGRTSTPTTSVLQP